MGPLIVKDFNVEIIRLPLHQPFRIAGGEHQYLENVFLKLKLLDGTVGLGEAAIAPHITGETVHQTFENLNIIGRWLAGQDISDYFKISYLMRDMSLKNASVMAAVEGAVLDALTQMLDIPLWHLFGESPQRLTTDITIVIADLRETIQAAKRYYQAGFRAFKVKIGRDEDLDMRRLIAIKKIVKNSKIYLDANQAYQPKQVLKFLKELQHYHIIPDLIEQPVRREDWDGLKEVSHETKIPVCADESVQSLGDAVRLIKENAAKVINIKLMKTGISAAREMAYLAQAKGIKLMIGGMMETSVSMMTAAHLAAGMGCFEYIDLDTPFFIKSGTRHNPYLNSKGVYDLRKVKRGIGIKKI